MKFLIDECLSPALAKLAQDREYWESSHVIWRGLGGKKDWELKPVILDGDWTFVTRNAIDFRGPLSRPGTQGQYAGVAIHAGLICLSGPDDVMDLDLQLELFEEALAELETDPDLVNQVLDITLESSGELRVLRYKLPPD